MNYALTSPCGNCPFRSDKRFPLHRECIEEIEAGLVRGEFACHKTTVPHEDSEGVGDRVETPDSEHCAGALILLEKLNRPSQMMRIRERLGFYDRTKLKMKAPVYDSFEEMMDRCGI